MRGLLAFWARMPTLVRAVVGGLVTLLFATFVWQGLLIANVTYDPSLPWSVPIMAIYMLLYWRYLSGKTWPAATQASRSAWLPQRPLSAGVWLWGLTTGSLIVVSLYETYFGIVGRLVELPQSALPETLVKAPELSVAGWFLMTSLVAGFAEEGVFRGHMLSMLRERYGGLFAILVVGAAFALAHGFGNWPNFGYYFMVSLVYSALTLATGSVLPAALLHALWDLFAFLWVWKIGLPERAAPLAETGLDERFWHVAAIAGGLAALAFASAAMLALALRRQGRAAPA